MNHLYFLERACQLAEVNIGQGGGPFGAIIVKDDVIIAEAGNSVTRNNDPTAHAEVQVIRKACEVLGHFQLTDCILYTSCEPCPMCFGAIYWARPKAVYYACNKIDAASIGFDDAFIYQELEKPYQERKIYFQHLHVDEGQRAFQAWTCSSHKIQY
ncbi:nucleoside deaminase [Ectobacillus sp. JY-23]|uniref:nucleoside deaminase n=1 Tax=Ectobacillus sp. JY-23 TaxID=2933872 RepID=UPI001FF3A29C|nr:nucleoside deaminase [Ectobacillus sp. JY-23]UOY93024.1 nucleoside deaminase [Ectobacillus sp. JY-23]